MPDFKDRTSNTLPSLRKWTACNTFKKLSTWTGTTRRHMQLWHVAAVHVHQWVFIVERDPESVRHFKELNLNLKNVNKRGIKR